MVASACSNRSNPENTSQPVGKVDQTKTVPPEPITLKVYGNNATVIEFSNKFINGPIHEKFPNISFEFVNGQSPEQLLAANQFPDLGFFPDNEIIDALHLKIPADLTPFMKKYNLNFDQYTKEAQDYASLFSEVSDQKQGLYGLPFLLEHKLMYYNQDIFDKFGVPYPTDRMTWSQVISTATKLTREDGGTQYKGVQPGPLELIAPNSTHLLPNINPTTGKADVDNPAWKEAFTFISRIYSIPGNGPNLKANLFKQSKDFLKEKNIAMLPWWGLALETTAKTADFRWDVVSYPSRDSDKKIDGLSGQLLFVSNTSKHKDEAFQIIQYMSSSMDVQKEVAKSANGLPVLKIPDVDKLFGSDIPGLKGKNTAGIFKVDYDKRNKANYYDGLVANVVNDYFLKYLAGEMDANTALRSAQAEADRQLAAAKEK
jgi:multiple sugar transport system substrate-binding protein